jgi:hypothetical protein
VAGNDKRNRIGGTGPRHGSRRALITYMLPGKLLIGARTAIGYSLECPPDLPLKRGAAQVKRQVRLWRLTVQISHDAIYPLARHTAVRLYAGGWVFGSEASAQGIIIIAQADHTDTLTGSRYQHSPEGIIHNTVPDVHNHSFPVSFLVTNCG